MNKKVKSIAFRAEIVGNGGVNYDDLDTQKWAYMKQKFAPPIRTNNYSLHKANYYRKKEVTGDTVEEYLERVLKIDYGCLREAIFNNVQPIYKTDIFRDKKFFSVISKPSFLIRGFLFASTKWGALKRKSPLSFPGAEEGGGAYPTLAVGSSRDVVSRVKKNGEPTEPEENSNENEKTEYVKSDLSLFYKETMGKTQYSTTGFLDLGEMAFIPTDDRYLRMAVPFDHIDEFVTSFEKSIGHCGAVRGGFEKIGSEIPNMERGIHMSDNQVLAMTKYFFRLLINTKIVRAGGMAEVSRISYRFIYEDDINSRIICDSVSFEEFGNGIITNINDVDNINFDFSPSYVRIEDDLLEQWIKEQDSLDEDGRILRKEREELELKKKEETKKKKQAKKDKQED